MNPPALKLSQFKNTLKDTSITLLDLRHQHEFITAHIANSLFVGIEGPFDKWIQLLIPDKNQKLLFILPLNAEQAAINKLNMLGYVNSVGYLEGGIKTWTNSNNRTRQLNSISAKDFIDKAAELTSIIDVRKQSEYEHDYLLNTTLNPLEINTNFIKKFTPKETHHVFCGGGYRSVIAISYLNKNNTFDLVNIEGGFRAIKNHL